MSADNSYYYGDYYLLLGDLIGNLTSFDCSGRRKQKEERLSLGDFSCVIRWKTNHMMVSQFSKGFQRGVGCLEETRLAKIPDPRNGNFAGTC